MEFPLAIISLNLPWCVLQILSFPSRAMMWKCRDPLLQPLRGFPIVCSVFSDIIWFSYFKEWLPCLERNLVDGKEKNRLSVIIFILELYCLREVSLKWKLHVFSLIHIYGWKVKKCQLCESILQVIFKMWISSFKFFLWEFILWQILQIFK